MQGPPFSVQYEEIKRLYHDWYDVELLANEDVLEREQHFKERGLSQLREQVYRLVARRVEVHSLRQKLPVAVNSG